MRTLMPFVGAIATTLNTAIAQPPSPRVDHHVHILGPDVMRDWKAVGVTFSRPDTVYTSAAALLRAGGDTAWRAVLVPMSHLYATEDFVLGLKLDAREERRRVQRENDHVAAEARRFPGRAVALCSAPALRSYALEEFQRCRHQLGVAGIKLHLASSQVDLRNEQHLVALDLIAKWAVQAQLPIMLHFDPQRRGLDTGDVRRFATRVLEHHPESVVVVAHLGGSGGYGTWTRSVFRTLSDWRRAVEAAGAPRRRLYFDVSAVLLERESEGVPATTPAQIDALRGDLRAMAFDGIVFGSDYPVFDPDRGVRVLRDVIGLSEAEINRIVRATSPFFKAMPSAR